MPSLRDELRGDTLPEFTLTLPAGWIRQQPTEAVRDQMLAAGKQRLMALHRPDLYAQFLPMMHKMFRDMSRTEVVAFFIPGPDAPDDAYLPATLTASVRRGPHGASLDAAVAQLIREEGATGLGDDKRILRWEREQVETLEGTRVPSTTVAYFIPVPETGRTKALQFTLVITHPDLDNADDREFVDALKLLFDAHLSTFSWLRPNA